MTFNTLITFLTEIQRERIFARENVFGVVSCCKMSDGGNLRFSATHLGRMDSRGTSAFQPMKGNDLHRPLISVIFLVLLLQLSCHELEIEFYFCLPNLILSYLMTLK